ncbi:hypothetical protein [Acinetobacter sp.]|uniref:hypothetical protein n=1 Tax=Acinetobacter sp. TaxID=472 RepID=UPI0031D9D3A9
MAFDLFQYFAEQTKIQKPQHFQQYTAEKANALVLKLNALVLGKLIHESQVSPDQLYKEIHQQDPLYIQQLARHLTTSPQNKSTLPKAEFEQLLSDIFELQFKELKQLDDIGHLGQGDLIHLLKDQIDYLSGQAEDWIWRTNQLTSLVGSKPIIEEDTASLDDSIQEFNHMVHSHHDQDQHVAEPTVAEIPTWAKIVEPVVALVVLAYLYCVYTQLTVLH